MNRLVLVGNGFDLAHGLKTSYQNFIDAYWKGIIKQWKTAGNDPVDTDEVRIPGRSRHPNTLEIVNIDKNRNNVCTYNGLRALIDSYGFVKIDFKNKFLEQISESGTKNWVDIEQMYYNELKDIIINRKTPYLPEVERLNKDLDQIEKLLQKYLMDLPLNEILPKFKITEKLYSVFRDRDLERRAVITLQREIQRCNNISDIAPKQEYMRSHHLVDSHSKRDEFIDNTSKWPDNLLIVNFNYTNLISKYTTSLSSDFYDIINIHGSLRGQDNPIVFGYGDEFGEEYQKIENLNSNEALRKMKSIKYLQTENYRKVRNFIESDVYQVFIFGHSCGLSDRTLLQTIFEHDNCISIKPFYYTWEDNGVVKDNFMELTCNISRNFKDKIMMRDRVVNKEFCERLMR